MDEKNHVNRLLDLYNKKKFDKVITSGLPLTKVYTKNPIILNIIGLSYMNIKKYSEALSIFDELIKKFPDNAEAYINIGIIHRIFGQQDKAGATKKLDAPKCNDPTPAARLDKATTKPA